MTMHDCVLSNIININHFLYQYIVLKYTQNSIIRLYISRIVTDFQSKSSENMDQKMCLLSKVQGQEGFPGRAQSKVKNKANGQEGLPGRSQSKVKSKRHLPWNESKM